MYGYVIGIINTDKIFYDKKTSVIIIEAEFILKRDYMKQNHHSLAYKRQKQPNKTYKDLKQKQKMKIADQMFRETCSYYKENGEMPTEEAAREITERIYKKLESQAVWVPFDEVYQAYLLTSFSYHPIYKLLSLKQVMNLLFYLGNKYLVHLLFAIPN